MSAMYRVIQAPILKEKSLDELNKNLQEVIALLLEPGKITKSSGIQPQNNVGIDNMSHIII